MVLVDACFISRSLVRVLSFISCHDVGFILRGDISYYSEEGRLCLVVASTLLWPIRMPRYYLLLKCRFSFDLQFVGLASASHQKC